MKLPAIFKWFSRSRPKFQKGQSVQPERGNQHMVIESVHIAKSHDISYLCSWFDAEQKSSKSHVFKEGELRPFNWAAFHKSFCESLEQEKRLREQSAVNNNS